MKFVYILQSVSQPDRFYTGLTADADARLLEHNAGEARHTAKYKPWKMIVAIRIESDDHAVKFERFLKSGSGRAFARRHFG